MIKLLRSFFFFASSIVLARLFLQENISVQQTFPCILWLNCGLHVTTWQDCFSSVHDRFMFWRSSILNFFLNCISKHLKNYWSSIVDSHTRNRSLDVLVDNNWGQKSHLFMKITIGSCGTLRGCLGQRDQRCSLPCAQNFLRRETKEREKMEQAPLPFSHSDKTPDHCNPSLFPHIFCFA